RQPSSGNSRDPPEDFTTPVVANPHADQSGSVRCEAQVTNPLDGHLQGGQLLPKGDVPEADGSRSACDDQLAIRREHHAVNSLSGPPQHVPLLPSGDIPEPEDPKVIGCGHHAAVRTESDSTGAGWSVSFQAAEQPPGRTLPESCPGPR